MSTAAKLFGKWWEDRRLRRPESTRTGTLTHFPSSTHGFLLSGWFLQSPHHPFLVVVPNVKVQEELASDLTAWGTSCLVFPPTERLAEGASPNAETEAERFQVLEKLGPAFQGVVLIVRRSLDEHLPALKSLKEHCLIMERGRAIPRDEFVKRMVAAGYTREAMVQDRGQFSVRGAVLDLYPREAMVPLRTEWEDDELISIREFDLDTQRSIQPLKKLEVRLAPESGESDSANAETATVYDYLPRSVQTFSIGGDDDLAEASFEESRLCSEFIGHDFLHASKTDFILQEQRRERFLDHLRDWVDEGWSVFVFSQNEGEQKRLTEIVTEAQIDPESIQFDIRPVLRGFVWIGGKIVVLADAEIFGRYQTLTTQRKQERLVSMRSQHQALDFSEIQDGDYVVHMHHGIALYKGTTELPGAMGSGDEGREVLVLEFAEKSILYVPMEQAFLVTKYVGVGKRHPALDTMGGARWERAKISTQKAVMDYAAQLISVQATRESQVGYTFQSDTPWQQEFEDSFVYEETEDQMRAIVETKLDMQRARPMDRLICGDVGFGKTEVAIRAVFKAIQEGKQAAFLAPTTVLAEQHLKTLRERYAGYPFRVECLNRLRSAKEERDTLEGLKNGSVDVVVGTHRLLSKDVRFKSLGLVIIDEEQRFGVKQKEKFKQLFQLVDVLTLSATPIPRTLYLSLTGARDMSTIETAPPNRHPVETMVCPYDERIIRDAISREMERSGQVYFLHNRISSLPDTAERIQALVPKAKIVIGHGQMEPDELEDVMTRFIEGRADILLSTTIIESGIDIPNANTIIIDRADRFGLADLYQLRGRVGRAHHRAYAYLFLPRSLLPAGEARKRVSAIKQYTQLGSGFKIAMRDLEIRGAGNLLGTAQSGHITAVGFDLYCQLLKMAVAKMKGEKAGRLIETKLEFDFLVWSESDEDTRAGKYGAFLPRSFMSETRWRMEGYKRLAETSNVKELEVIRQEWRDKHGKWPETVERLLLSTAIKIQASQARIVLVETQGEKLMLRQGQDYVMVGGKFPRLTEQKPLRKLKEILAWIDSLLEKRR